MNAININEQIAYYRKQRGLTQEDVARALGVTNQAVSKWESAQCCPDIALLPELACLFDVSVDELLGRKPKFGLGELCLSLKAYFAALPRARRARTSLPRSCSSARSRCYRRL